MESHRKFLLILNGFRFFLAYFSKRRQWFLHFFAFQPNYTPPFLPFSAKNRFARLGVWLHSIRKTQKMGKSRICKNADDYGLFHLFLPSCTGRGHLFPCRYEVGWACILNVDLFPHTSKCPIFTALPPFGAFLRQKRGFPSFLERRKSIKFSRFLAIFSHFCDSATPPSQHAR